VVRGREHLAGEEYVGLDNPGAYRGDPDAVQRRFGPERLGEAFNREPDAVFTMCPLPWAIMRG
jgi:hypothetical protein